MFKKFDDFVHFENDIFATVLPDSLDRQFQNVLADYVCGIHTVAVICQQDTTNIADAAAAIGRPHCAVNAPRAGADAPFSVSPFVTMTSLP